MSTKRKNDVSYFDAETVPNRVDFQEPKSRSDFLRCKYSSLLRII